MSKASSWLLVGLGLLFILVLAMMDYLSGPDLAVGIFYLAPIVTVASVKGFGPAAALAIVAATAWGTADVLASDTYSTPFIPIWNSTTRLGIFLIVGRLVASQRVQVDKERELARVDSLTGVGNTRAFEERAAMEIDRARRYGGALTVAYLDLDDFKKINDSLGHSRGDEVLREIGSLLVRSTRAADFVARLGGDEFAILLPSTGKARATAVLDGLSDRVRSSSHVADGLLSFTLGAVTFKSAPDSVDEMIRAADSLMYEGKRKLKGSVVQAEVGEGGPPQVIHLDGMVPPRVRLTSQKDLDCSGSST